MSERKMSRYVYIIIIFLLWSGYGYSTCIDTEITDTPTSNFIIHQNGTVTDTTTGLMWKRCPEGMTFNDSGTPTNVYDDYCGGSSKIYIWQEALQQASVSVFAGRSDWRVPNIKELRSIIERACRDPALNTVVFLGGPANNSYRFWSSTPSNSFNSTLGTYPYAWVVYFQGGSTLTDAKTDATVRNNSMLRLVRGGQ
jgi:hypothetical protein